MAGLQFIVVKPIAHDRFPGSILAAASVANVPFRHILVLNNLMERSIAPVVP